MTDSFDQPACICPEDEYGCRIADKVDCPVHPLKPACICHRGRYGQIRNPACPLHHVKPVAPTCICTDPPLIDAHSDCPACNRVGEGQPFQNRVHGWMLECFGAEIAGDKLERNDRFIEEALELVQSTDYPRERALALVDYVYGRPIGEPSQEVGGVRVTLAALCIAHGIDGEAAAETELTRILAPEIIAKIRAKQAAKPTGSALPIAAADPVAAARARCESTGLVVMERRTREVWEDQFVDPDDLHAGMAVMSALRALRLILPDAGEAT